MTKALRLSCTLVATALLAPVTPTAAGTVPWRAYADCAAGYRANWQDRLQDPSRTSQMRDMIRSQADDYEAAAARHYRQETHATVSQAKAAVQGYIEKNLDRFIAMDKRDELNDFLDMCPQPDESGSL